MIKVRRAKLSDAGFIARLASQTAKENIPPSRDRQKAEKNCILTEEDIVYFLKVAKDKVFLLAEDEEEPAGYMLLLFDKEETTCEKQVLIYDVAVEESYRGKYVAHKLLEEAEKVTLAHGIEYLVGRIAVNNRRALGTAQSLGFEIERYQVVKKLGISLKLDLGKKPKGFLGTVNYRI